MSKRVKDLNYMLNTKVTKFCVIHHDLKRLTQFCTSIFPELYMVHE